jgi:hypothetical protein
VDWFWQGRPTTLLTSPRKRFQKTRVVSGEDGLGVREGKNGAGSQTGGHGVFVRDPIVTWRHRHSTPVFHFAPDGKALDVMPAAPVPESEPHRLIIVRDVDQNGRTRVRELVHITPVKFVCIHRWRLRRARWVIFHGFRRRLREALATRRPKLAPNGAPGRFERSGR